ncbi:MAG: hypothetical protein HS106_06540 [Ideonella sp.]|nr:hypothetical protein [Ideonella sp.]
MGTVMQFEQRASRRTPERIRCRLAALPAAVVVALGLPLALGGCASSPAAQSTPPASAQAQRGDIAAALRNGKPEAARPLLTAALRAEPQNGYLHLLNGLTYQLADASQQSAELAQVGYDAAVKFAPGYYWSHYYAGLAKFSQRNYPAAAEEFAWAVLDRPDAPQAFAALAASAYYGGDLGVAQLAAERALALAPTDPQALRAAAYVAAARGDRQYLAAVIERANALPAGGLSAHTPRLSQLLRGAALSASDDRAPPAATRVAADDATQRAQEPQTQPPTEAAPPPSDSLQQVMVEVTLLLSQDTTKHSVGINLLDGLRLQFGGDSKTERRYSTGAADSFSRVITTALSVPQITYSLNLFNTHDDFYDVVVRPSLVASLGQQSEFFIGRTLSVAVSGINAGTLQTIDVGTAVKLTPLEINNERTKFRVDTVRSFFVPTSSGTFAESVTTFKQTVGATAEVEFGKTLILSGLYEAVNVGWTSKVPVLGDIPVANLLFNERSKTQSRDAAIVLVTPRLAGSIDSGTREFRAESLKKLLSVWKELVDPLSNFDALTDKLGDKLSKYFRPQPADMKLSTAADSTIARQAIGETLERLR